MQTRLETTFAEHDILLGMGVARSIKTAFHLETPHLGTHCLANSQ